MTSIRSTRQGNRLALSAALGALLAVAGYASTAGAWQAEGSVGEQTPTEVPTPTPTSNRPPAIARGIAAPNPAASGQQVQLLDNGSFGGVAGRFWEQIEGPAVELTGFPPTFAGPDVAEPTLIAFNYSVCNFDSGCDIDRVEVTIVPSDLTPSPTPTGRPFNTPTISCSLQVQPAVPAVGDAVAVTVLRTSNGLGYPEYHLQSDPLFTGVTGQNSTGRFQLRAVQTGTTELRGSTLDEFIVGYNDNLPIYSFYPALCTLSVEIVASAATPTFTPTVTNTPTQTQETAPQEEDDSGGCQLAPARGAPAVAVSWLPIVVLLAALRRAHRRSELKSRIPADSRSRRSPTRPR